MIILWVLFKFVIISFVVVNAKDTESQCMLKESCTPLSESPKSNKYGKENNQLIEKINRSQMNYSPCEKSDDCSCYSSFINEDLKSFQSSGITKFLIDSVTAFGTKYQIVDHRLYRQKSCSFPSRCAGIEHFIKPLLQNLPNMELIINCRDWPQLLKASHPQGPVFSFSKTKNYVDIMYPAWSFWEGGPAIALHPTGIGRWDRFRKIIATAAKKWPWSEKLSKAFFRGSRTSDERDSIILLSRKKFELVDAQYTKNQAWKSSADTLNADPAVEVSFEDHCQYKYLFNFRGVAASFRFKHLFLCKSLVFHVGDEWLEFFYTAMKPWVHYVPIKSYPSQKDIEKILQFFIEHDDLAQQIAENGYNFIWNHLKLSDVQCYWKTLLLEYGKLVRYEVRLDKSFKQIS